MVRKNNNINMTNETEDITNITNENDRTINNTFNKTNNNQQYFQQDK